MVMGLSKLKIPCNYCPLVVGILSSLFCFLPMLLWNNKDIINDYVHNKHYSESYLKSLEVSIIISLPIFLNLFLDLTSSNLTSRIRHFFYSRLSLVIILVIPNIIILKKLLPAGEFLLFWCLICASRIVFVSIILVDLSFYGAPIWNSCKTCTLALLWSIAQILESLKVDQTTKYYSIMHALSALLFILFFIGVFCLTYLWYQRIIHTQKCPDTKNMFVPETCFLVYVTTLYILIMYILFVLLIGVTNLYKVSEANCLTSSSYIIIILTVLLEMLPGRVAREEVFLFEKALEAKKMFVRYVSHEIRTPLNTVFLGLQLLQDEHGKNPKLLKTVLEVKESCEVALNVLNDVLSYDKMQDGAYQLELQTMNGLALLNDVIKPFYIQARQSGIDLNIVNSAELPVIFKNILVRVDQNKFKQVFRNVISNALKFTSRGGSVTIKIRCLTYAEAYPENTPASTSRKNSGFEDSLRSRLRKSIDSLGLRRFSINTNGSTINPGGIVEDITLLSNFNNSNNNNVYNSKIGKSTDSDPTANNKHFSYFGDTISSSFPSTPTVWGQSQGLPGAAAQSSGGSVGPIISRQNSDGVGGGSSAAGGRGTAAGVSLLGSARSSVIYDINDIIRVEVIDTGPGISLENQQRLFKEAIQFNPGKLQKGQGSGLGLFISKTIIDLHHGKISVFSLGEGHGCTFTIDLPIYKHDSSTGDAELLQTSSSFVDNKSNFTLPVPIIPKLSLRPDTGTSKVNPYPHRMSTIASLSSLSSNILESYGGPANDTGGHLLVVDDSESNRKMLCRLLHNKGYSTIEAIDGVDAVNMIRQSIKDGNKIDAVLTDYMMTTMDGPDATREMRILGYTGVIIGITGNAMPTDIEVFMINGANRVFSKPVNIPALENALKELLPRISPRRGSAFTRSQKVRGGDGSISSSVPLGTIIYDHRKSSGWFDEIEEKSSDSIPKREDSTLSLYSKKTTLDIDLESGNMSYENGIKRNIKILSKYQSSDREESIEEDYSLLNRPVIKNYKSYEAEEIDPQEIQRSNSTSSSTTTTTTAFKPFKKIPSLKAFSSARSIVCSELAAIDEKEND